MVNISQNLQPNHAWDIVVPRNISSNLKPWDIGFLACIYKYDILHFGQTRHLIFKYEILDSGQIFQQIHNYNILDSFIKSINKIDNSNPSIDRFYGSNKHIII